MAVRKTKEGAALKRWFKEKWVDVSRKVKGKHPPCGRKDADGKAYPKCRPSKKVSKETPKISSSYDKKEKKAILKSLKHEVRDYPKNAKDFNKSIENHTTIAPESELASKFW